jgi:hypothetical protein
MTEDGRQMTEFGRGKVEVGSSEHRAERMVHRKTEFGSRTRRRPIRQDYAAAKDAKVGKGSN